MVNPPLRRCTAKEQKLALLLLLRHGDEMWTTSGGDLQYMQCANPHQSSCTGCFSAGPLI